MKIIYVLLLLTSLCSDSYACYKIMTYDQPSTYIQNSWLSIQKHPLLFKYALQIIKEHQPDIIAWQEMQKVDIEKLIKNFVHYACYTNNDVNFIMYNHELFESLQTGIMWLDVKPTQQSNVLTWEQFQNKHNNHIFWVFNAFINPQKTLAFEAGDERSLSFSGVPETTGPICKDGCKITAFKPYVGFIDSMIEQEREESVAKIAQIIQALNKDKQLAFLVGNFNEEPSHKTIEQLFEEPYTFINIKDLFDQKNRIWPEATWVNWNYEDECHNAIIDHIFVNNTHLTVDEYKVIEFHPNQQASPHRPVMVVYTTHDQQ